MGGINIKLIQGIDDAESQLQKEKQTQKGEEKVEHGTKDIQKTAEKSQKVKKQPMSKKNTSMRKKAVIEPDRISKKQVFSFRAVLTDIVIWKSYAIASGKTMEDICNVAMNEYLNKHKLAGAEQAIFEALKGRDGIGRE